MTSDLITDVFAWAPLTAFVIVFTILYAATRRRQPAESGTPLGKTYACAQCGRRGGHEHMVPVTREGAVLWYCGRCSH